MPGRLRGAVRALALVAVGALLATTVFAGAAKKPAKPAKRQPTPAHSIRDTGVGLPQIGSQGTLGIAEFTESVRDYHDSGSYAADLEAVGSQAESFMVRQAKAVRAQARRRCAAKPKKPCRKPKPAIVLDIDETSLSNYEELDAASFSGAQGALVLAITSADSPAIAPTLDLYRRAVGMKVSVFFVTGRLPGLEGLTRQNLAAAGYTQVAGLYMKPSDQPTIEFKSASRADIERRGYRIIVNVGDQESDLTGGGADRTYKLPNPFYFIG